MKANDRTLIVGLATLLLAGGLAACEHGELIKQEPTTAPKQVPLQLTSGILSTVTRAYDSSWETDDEIGVFTVKAGSTNTADITRSGTYEDANIRYKLSDNAGETYYSSTSSYNYQTFTSVDKVTIGAQEEDKKIYLPIDGSNVDVYAYYPYDGSATASAKTITLETSQTLAGQKTYDLMSAKADKCSDGTNPINLDHTSAQLLFRHELSKVLIKVKAGKGYSNADLANVAVELQGQATTATFHPLTRTLDVGEATGTITPYKLLQSDADYSKLGDSYYIYRALVMPTTTASGSVIIAVGSTTTASFSYSFPQALPAGYETAFTLTLQATGMIVTAAITPWSESSSVPETPLYEQ